MLLALGSTVTNTAVISELNRRNYYLATTSTPSPIVQYVPLQQMTQAQVLTMSVTIALQNANYAPIANTRTELSSSVWQQVVLAAIQMSTELSQKYTILSGLSGLGATDISWWDTYMPTILQIAGSAATIWGTSWQTKVTRDQISNQVAAATGAAIPAGAVGTQVQANEMALKFQQQGMSAADAQARANNIVLGIPIPSGTAMPAWLLPVGIGVVAFMLLQRK